MANKTSPTFIGAFVVGAIALLVGALLLFGKHEFGVDSLAYTMYFDGSLKGLNVGAPVTFRGVKLGSVKNIQVSRMAASDTIRAPVSVEIVTNQFAQQGAGEALDQTEVRHYMQELVDQGLRASIGVQSVVTGQLYVALAFDKRAEPAQIEQRDGEYIFPTVRSPFNVIADELQALPITDIVNQALVALQGINRVVNSDALNDSMQAIHESANGFDTLIETLNKDVPSTLKRLDTAVANANQLLVRTDALVADGSADAIDTLAGASKLVAQAQQTLSAYEKLTTNSSGLNSELRQALQEVSAAARSMRLLTDYLERHPEVLLRGKRGLP